MRILDIREAKASIRSEIRNAYIDFSEMTVSVLALITDQVRDGRQVVGFGFNSNGRYAPSGILRERVIPRVLGAAPEDMLDEAGRLAPEKVWAQAMRNEKPGGHGERSVALAVLDMAVWDALAKAEETPLYRLLAERYRGGEVDGQVFVYAAGGYYYPAKGVAALEDEMKGYLDLGYNTVKMKIGGAAIDEDERRIEAVLGLVGSGDALAVDANGRFDLETALAYARMMAPYDLRWFEELGDPLDFELQAELAQAYDGPLATGENLFSRQEALNLIRYAGMRADRDVLQFDPALGYGQVEYLRILEMLEGHGWSARRCVPHGGHQMALNIAASLGLGGNESYPGVFQPFGGFADDIAVEDGHVRLPEIPGVGFEAKAALYEVLKALAEG